MTTANKPSSDHDERLADFTDQVLKGQIKETVSNADDELRGLQETILRLNRFLPPASLNEAAIKQMQARLHARIRRDSDRAEEQSIWKKWFAAGQMRPQIGVAFIVMLTVVFIVLIPSLATPVSPVTATALTTSLNIATAFILAGLIFVIFWITRRK